MTTPVQSTAATTSDTASTTAVASNGSASSDLFMKLLVAQIQNQDPLSPTDSKDFVQQFATMTQVKSMEAMTSMTSASAAVQQSLLTVGFGGQIGSNVSVATDSVTLADTPISGSFTLDGSATDGGVVLTGSDGAQHRVALGPQQAGTVEFTVDPKQLGLPAGTYSVHVLTSAGASPDPHIDGRLLAVRMDQSGKVMLSVRGVGEVATSDIVGLLGSN